jgi:hypothetical protein
MFAKTLVKNLGQELINTLNQTGQSKVPNIILNQHSINKQGSELSNDIDI